MKSIGSLLKEGIRYQTAFMLIIAGTSLSGLILVITADVIGRIFDKPIGSAYEVSSVLMGTLILLGLANTTARDIHTRVELLYSRFSPKVKAGVSCFITIGMMAIWFIMCWQNIVAGIGYMQRGQQTDYLGIPLYPFYFLVALGAFACLLESSIHLGSWIHRLKGDK